MTEYRPYNPLDKQNLGESVLRELLGQPVVPMPPPPIVVPGRRRKQYDRSGAFRGAGVYAIYYTGERLPFPDYEPVAERNRGGEWSWPIYVGKADPKGSRSGQDLNLDPGFALYDRLTLHSESIANVNNLDLADFHCRHLPVDDAFIGLGEIVIIQQLRPLWNSVGQGFGSKVLGGGRAATSRRSRWDTLHPGRPGAGLKDNKLTLDQLLDLVRKQLAGEISLPATLDDDDPDDELEEP